MYLILDIYFSLSFMPKVSIVIVCMNNLKNLYPCLNSIREHTFIDYETFVVAYLFSQDNLRKVKQDFPWVTFIESDEIRGFSENNNLALRRAKGKYCFVVNDNTYIKSSVIDDLVNTYNILPDNAAIVSPNILNPDGSIQCCGRPYISWVDYILLCCKLWKESNPNKYSNKKGVFQTYNILGAGFLIKTDIFLKVGFFDERYFFSPEDIALSTLLNREGYSCFVNSDVYLYHKGGGTKWSPIVEATRPAGALGARLFFSDDSKVKFMLISFVILITKGITSLYYYIKSLLNNEEIFTTKAKAFKNVCKAMFSKKTPKEIFVWYYDKIKNKR